MVPGELGLIFGILVVFLLIYWIYSTVRN